MVVDEREDLTVKERLEAAEKRIAFLNREVVSLGWGLFAIVAVAVIAVLVNALWFSHQHPAASNRDASESDLLAGGVHCYDSPEERAAARQRALAAIDRMKWEQELRNRPQGDRQMWGTAPVDPSSIPSIWDAPENLASLEADPALCFSVQYLP